MAMKKQQKSTQAARAIKKTSATRRQAAPRPARGTAPKAGPTGPATSDDEDEAVDSVDDSEIGAPDVGEVDEDEDDRATEVDPQEAAASRIGRSIHAHLEVLHMSDRDGAIAAISTIVPVPAELAQVGADLEALGATDLARDVRLAVDRMERAR